MSPPPATASRPVLHLTPRLGWLNDPHGVLFRNGRYHLFFQLHESGRAWAPQISWGHASSADLVTWRHEPTALEPLSDETGCWTGALVETGSGDAVILYTSVGGGLPLGEGRIAIAYGDPTLTTWSRDVDRFVISAVPTVEGDVVHAFRDPCVWWHEDHWRMVVGAGLDRGGGAVVQYRSPDLVSWTYDGLLLDAGTVVAPGERLGTTWECPQLFALGGSWVLLVSVWDAGELCHVSAAVGDYDGRRFTPRTWTRFTHGDLLYASTTFVDEAGRRCLVSWLREHPGDSGRGDEGQPWAGALSVPYVLSLDGDQLGAAMHPAATFAATSSDDPGVRYVERKVAAGDAVELGEFTVVAGSGSLQILASDGAVLATAVVETAESYDVAALVDTGIIEVTASGLTGMLAARALAGEV